MVLTESQAKLHNGDKAPDFQLEGADGKQHSLQEFLGSEGMLIIFMCNHCPYVKAKIDTIVKLHDRYGDKIAFAGVNSNDPAYPEEGMDNMKDFAAEWGIRFSYLLDDTQEVAKSYGATCTPDPFLFDRDGKLVFHGRIDDALQPGDTAREHTMADNIRKMLKGEKLDEEFKPSMGCSIKWTP